MRHGAVLYPAEVGVFALKRREDGVFTLNCLRLLPVASERVVRGHLEGNVLHVHLAGRAQHAVLHLAFAGELVAVLADRTRARQRNGCPHGFAERHPNRLLHTRSGKDLQRETALFKRRGTVQKHVSEVESARDERQRQRIARLPAQHRLREAGDRLCRQACLGVAQILRTDFDRKQLRAGRDCT